MAHLSTQPHDLSRTCNAPSQEPRGSHGPGAAVRQLKIPGVN